MRHRCKDRDPSEVFSSVLLSRRTDEKLFELSSWQCCGFLPISLLCGFFSDRAFLYILDCVHRAVDVVGMSSRIPLISPVCGSVATSDTSQEKNVPTSFLEL